MSGEYVRGGPWSEFLRLARQVSRDRKGEKATSMGDVAIADALHHVAEAIEKHGMQDTIKAEPVIRILPEGYQPVTPRCQVRLRIASTFPGTSSHVDVICEKELDHHRPGMPDRTHQGRQRLHPGRTRIITWGYEDGPSRPAPADDDEGLPM